MQKSKLTDLEVRIMEITQLEQQRQIKKKATYEIYEII